MQRAEHQVAFRPLYRQFDRFQIAHFPTMIISGSSRRAAEALRRTIRMPATSRWLIRHQTDVHELDGIFYRQDMLFLLLLI